MHRELATPPGSGRPEPPQTIGLSANHLRNGSYRRVRDLDSGDAQPSLDPLIVGTRSGHTVDELGDLLSAAPARWWLIGVARTYGSARVFDSRRVADALAKLRRHPAVASAEHEGLAAPGVDPPPHFPSQLLATLPLDYGSPEADDGRVQGQKGALMTVRYTQPDGTVLTHTMAIP